MKNKIITIILIGIMLFLSAGISFAEYLKVYGTMEGITEVSTPEFYIGSIAQEELLINEKSSDCDSFTITAQYRTFKTKNLGGVNFNYIPKTKFYVRAESMGSKSQDLRVSFGYYKPNDSNPHYLCSKTITVEPEMKNYTIDFITCAEAPKNVGKLFYEFKEICEECEGIKYMIGKCAGGFYTKIELSD